MKKILFYTIFMLVTLLTFAEKVTVLAEIERADTLAVDDQQLYICQETSINIYSRKDYKFIKKFGKAGEGPKEFMTGPSQQIMVVPRQNDLMISSFGKVSFYSKRGEFIKEERTKAAGFFSGFYQPLKDGFIGLRMGSGNNQFFYVMSLYNSKLEETKELRRLPMSLNTGKWDFFPKGLDIRVYQNRLYMLGRVGLSVDVMDTRGKILFSFKRDYQPRKFTSEDERGMRDTLKKRMRGQYDFFKDRINIPSTYPPTMSIAVTGDRIYVLTWKREQGKQEFFIFDLQGKLLKHAYFPFAFLDAIRPSPYMIYEGQLFQAVENIDEEEWELHITDLK